MPVPSPAQRLQQHAAGGPPLVAPLFAMLCGELEGLTLREIAMNATKLSNTIRDLTRSLGATVATVEFGSRWDLEAAGAALDWSVFPPRVAGGAITEPAAVATAARGPVIIDAIGRVAALLGDQAVVAASVTGPVSAARELGDTDLRATAKLALEAVRALCDAGAKLVWVVEDGAAPPQDPAALAQASAAVLGTARFYRATAALHISGEADGWLDAVRVLRQAVPCFDAERSPVLAGELAGGSRAFGLLVGPAGCGAATAELAREPRCVLIAHDGELAGRIAARELRDAVGALERAAGVGG